MADTDVPASTTQQHSVLDLPKPVQDGRKKVLTILEEEVLDYKHNGAPAVEDCVATLATYFANVVDHPDDEKYRKIRTTNKAFISKVCKLHTRNGENPGERLLVAAGWRQQVVEMQKYWLFDAPASDTKFQILREARLLLDKSLATIHGKAEKQKHEAEVRRSKHQSEKERILLAIEDDKRMRAMVQQMVGPVTSPRGSAGGQEGSGRSSTSPREGGTGGDAAAGPGAAAAARASGAGAAADAS